MNCKQIDDLLPLYAGRDLDEKRARLVSEHLQACADCARVADEYRGAFQITQQFAAPMFSEDVYARVRRNVLNEIETQSATASRSDSFFGWFRPRTTWAIASAVVVAFAVLAFYLVVNRHAGNESIAHNQRVPSHNESIQSPRPVTPSAPSTGTSEDSHTETPRPLKPKKARSDRTGPLMATARDSSSTALKVSPKLPGASEPNFHPVNDSVQAQPLRVEMQTKDPNIRIIWFSQSNSKPALPNAKGI